MYSSDFLMPWVHALEDRVGDVRPFDVHVHLGLHDPAGLEATEEEAVAALEQIDSRALIFPLKEPEGYRGPNATLIDVAERHDGLRALARIDPAADPLEELERCLEAGAVGLKLHPRGEGFEIVDRRLDPVFAIADERRLPIMVHAGAGSPEIGDHALQRTRDYPDSRLILAHCAIGAYEAVIPHADEIPNLLFDTSWWNPSDVWGLLHAVRPGQILYASDIPFAAPALAYLLTTRLDIEAGLDDDQLAAVLAGQGEQLCDAGDLLDVGPLEADLQPLRPPLERIYVTLVSAVEPMLRGEAPGQGLDLARVACSRPHGPDEELIASIATLLDLVDRQQEPDPLRPLRTPGWDLVLAAAVLARTPSAPVPSQAQVDALVATGD